MKGWSDFMKRILALALALMLMLGAMTVATAETAAAKTPKYVFMFIGDGMGSPQISATQYYLGTLENPDAAMPTPASLSFTNFENIGIMTTYDATSFCPDSASTATAMASGEKTLSGVVNFSADKSKALKIITEYAKEAGKKVGVITSVSLDHATPAAYYAKAESRKQYYDIAVQGLSGATVDFFGGGGYLQPTGEKKDQKDIMEIAKENGFNVVSTVRASRP
jgi:alkaline phosphatase